MVDGHGVLEDLGEALAEAVGPDPGHAHGGEGRDLVERDRVPLAEDAGVEVRAVGPGARPDRQQGDGLVQVVDHDRVPAQVRVLGGAGQGELPLDAVAVVVVPHVLAPVGGGDGRQVLVVRLALEVPVEPVDHAVAAVGLRHGVDEDDHAVADLADVGRFRDGQPVRELHQHLGRARLPRVQAAVEHVEGLHARDELLGLALVRPAGIGEVGHRLAVPLEVVQALLVAHHHEQDLPAFLGLADRLHPHAARGLGERAVVRVDLRGARELAGRAHDVAEVLRGRGDVGVMRDVAHPGREEAWLRGGGGDRLRRARLGRVGGLGLGGAGSRRQKQQRHRDHVRPSGEGH